MAVYNSTEEAREEFKNDKFATINGVKLDELTEEYSICSMELTDNHKNAY
jgi:acyl-CoA thioesterase